MKEGRGWHGSGTLVDKGTKESIVVVAGGFGNDGYLDTTELLIDGEWQEGKKSLTNMKMFFVCFFCEFVCLLYF